MGPSEAMPEKGSGRKRRGVAAGAPHHNVNVGGSTSRAQWPVSKLAEYTLLASACGKKFNLTAANSQSHDETQAMDPRRKLLLMQNRDLEYCRDAVAAVPKSPELQRLGPRQHNKSFYAQSCKKILHFIHEKTMNWVLNEFFYSDIDKGW